MPRFKEKPLDRSQLMLYGRSVEDAVPSDCDVRGFGDVMSCLDYSRIASKCCERGCPPYPPQEMVKVVGYAYLKGIRSSRRIEEHLNFDVRFIWLAGGLKPDHNTIARFRKGNWEEFYVSGLHPAAILTMKRKGRCFGDSLFAPKHRARRCGSK